MQIFLTGVRLKITASFDDACLSGCLVVAPASRSADQLQGKRLGARVVGAAMWLHTMTALGKLGLDSASWSGMRSGRFAGIVIARNDDRLKSSRLGLKPDDL